MLETRAVLRCFVMTLTILSVPFKIVEGTTTYYNFLSIISIFATIIAAKPEGSGNTGDCVLCRQCGADISDSVHLIDVFSPSALIRGNQTLFGREDVQVQVLENPLGVRFRVVTFAKASCAPGHTWHNEHSWFPGYAWRHCMCPHCGHHLGWVFIPHSFNQEKSIYGLSVDSILSEEFSDSLMVIPKAYRS